MSSIDLVSRLLLESRAYSSLTDIEKMVEQMNSLQAIPLQPLYTILKSSSSDLVAASLSKLSAEQRELMLDMDLWLKDELDIEQFPFWIECYVKCPEDSIRLEFALSTHFSLYLKGVVNIWTFDLEEPLYPDHDYYFLTEDNLLLIEYGENYPHMEELKLLIKEIYTELGVENAYSYLFKVVSDSFYPRLEEEYKLKKGRMDDYGMVDYFQALCIKATYKNMAALDQDIARKLAKEENTGELDARSKSEVPHQKVLEVYENGFDDIKMELNKIRSDKRIDFTKFNFIKLINSGLTINNALKEGQVAVNRAGQEIKQILIIGLSYLKHNHKAGKDGLFLKLDFFDIYKVGETITSKPIANLVQVSSKLNLDIESESFWGQVLERKLNALIGRPIRFESDEKLKAVQSYNDWQAWQEQINFTRDLLPFMAGLKNAAQKLQDQASIHSSYFYNYDLDGLDFESILISAMINHYLKKKEKIETIKIGLSIDEFKLFADDFILSGEESFKLNQARWDELINSFKGQYGLGDIKNIELYLERILRSNLEGYNFNELELEDFKHIGGPILFHPKSS